MGIVNEYSKPMSFEDMEDNVDGVAGVVTSTPNAEVAPEVVAEEETLVEKVVEKVKELASEVVDGVKSVFK